MRGHLTLCRVPAGSQPQSEAPRAKPGLPPPRRPWVSSASHQQDSEGPRSQHLPGRTAVVPAVQKRGRTLPRRCQQCEGGDHPPRHSPLQQWQQQWQHHLPGMPFTLTPSPQMHQLTEVQVCVLTGRGLCQTGWGTRLRGLKLHGNTGG